LSNVAAQFTTNLAYTALGMILATRFMPSVFRARIVGKGTHVIARSAQAVGMGANVIAASLAVFAFFWGLRCASTPATKRDCQIAGWVRATFDFE
ncbi:MAG: hypothetical protein P8M30_20255, partial [Planctomycetaceae bacterium]|nr:hypothetical protein [Planctomycetaceae bacterium]